MNYKPFYWLMMRHLLYRPLQKHASDFNTRDLLRRAKPIYRTLLGKVKGVSGDNPMAANIYFSFPLIAVWLAADKKIAPETMELIFKEALTRPMIRKAMGKHDLNRPEDMKASADKLRQHAAWADAHPEDTNTWDFNFEEGLHQDGFSYHFTHCPIASFCKEQGIPEITPAICAIDFDMAALRGGRLIRKKTLAHGDDCCDFWFVGDQIVDPK